MRVEVSVPVECVEDVARNIAARRGRIQSRRSRGTTEVVQALVPLAGLFGYAADLQSRTRGRGTCTLEFDGYEAISPGDRGGDLDAFVGAPLRPAPKWREAGAAIPEPDEPEVGD
jgi:translation elongation factor EF-G